MATNQSGDELNYSMEDILETVLAEKSPEVCLAVGRQPTMALGKHGVGGVGVLEISPVTAEKMDSLFRSVAPPAQLEQLKVNGHVVFTYSFKAAKPNSRVAGDFRIEAKTANGRIVLLKCQILPSDVRPQ